MNKDIHTELENKFIHAAGSTIVKSVLAISFAVVAGIWVSSCQLDKTVIEECKSACGSERGIKEVTARSCQCNDLRKDTWVIPRQSPKATKDKK